MNEIYIESNLEGICIYLGSNISDALKNLNQSGFQLIFLIDKDKRLIGTISDGDIRRGLLNGYLLSDEVIKIANLNPHKITSQENKLNIKEIMKKNRIRQIPIIDSQEKLLGIYIWDQDYGTKKMENSLLIMAGGRGTRLGDITKKIPKPMVDIGGKPILEHIITRAREQGFKKIIISIYYLGHVIKEYFGDGAQFDVEITYIEEEQPLGTAGALSLLSPNPNLDLFIVNGDLLTDINYKEMLQFHKINAGIATMAVRINEIQNPFGVVFTDGFRIIGYEEKPLFRNLVNAGIYVISPELIKNVEKNTFLNMPDLFEIARKKGFDTVAFPIHEDWIDVGHPQDLKKAIRSWRED